MQAVLQWSGGKDSALAYHRLATESSLDVVTLQTMYDPTHERSSWHGIRCPVIEAQAAAIGTPVDLLPAAADVGTYRKRTTEAFERYREAGITYLAVGDIETEDPDMPREQAMTTAGLNPFYPLLGESPADLVTAFLDAGFRAKLAVVNGEQLDHSYAGRELTSDLIASLPDTVDIAGERGEYHTCVYDGPIFEEPLDLRVGEVVTRSIGETSYHYADLLLD